MALLNELDIWVDALPRSGAENMAVDQLLFEGGLQRPLLRFYQWAEPTVTLGYFEKLSDAQRDFGGAGLRYVRRWTGGGIVDHRVDETYTLFFPKGHAVEQMRGNESYAAIHGVLAESMRLSGVECFLTEDESASDARACFVNPVPYDILAADGVKLAGAGQRRSRNGLLHQGSVQRIADLESWRNTFAKLLADTLYYPVIKAEDLGEVAELARERYCSAVWTMKRV